MQKDNIILVGLPGAGKSTVGVLLAKFVGKGFLDTDLLLQCASGVRLPQIIEKEGSLGFLSYENRILAGLCVENTVIATGGSAVYGEDAMKHLASLGKVVYLKISYETLCLRVGDLVKRGVVGEHADTLEGIYRERIPLYEKYADVTVSAEYTNPADAARAVEEALGK